MRNIRLAIIAFYIASGVFYPALADVEAGAKALAAKDYRTAHREFLHSARKGNAEAQFQLGLLYFSGNGVPEDHEIALTYLRDAAGQGHRKAQHQLAYMRSHLISSIGSISKQTTKAELESLAEAAKWYEALAKEGNRTAVRELVQIIRWSQGRVGPKERYIHWLQRAAETGDNVSQFELAQRMMRGDGLAKNPSGAVRWAETAAFNGNGAAAREVGMAYIAGRFGERRPEDGVGLLYAATLRRDGAAHFALAESFAGGFVVAKNAVLAQLYLSRAKSRGFKDKARMGMLSSYLRKELAKLYIDPADLPSMPNLWRKAEKEQGRKMARLYEAAFRRFEARGR